MAGRRDESRLATKPVPTVLFLDIVLADPQSQTLQIIVHHAATMDRAE